MKIVIFGLTITSTWGNGHGTLWRGLCRAMHARGHSLAFYERDVPYYASDRDLPEVPWCRVVLYPSWTAIAARVRRDLADADVAIVTSYCPDGPDASDAVLASRVPRKVFYDLDSPITLERIRRGERVPYLPDEGLGGFDLVLSYAGGAALDELKACLGARAVAPLYGSVDPGVHRPVPSVQAQLNDLSYLGTYAADRQDALERLFVAPAASSPTKRFALAGSQYPADFPWRENIFYLSHMPPADHPAFFCSSALTLNVTRAAMAKVGFCPSGRLFEATACGTPVISDWWEGLDSFFEPEHEVLVARDTADVNAALERPDEERRRIGRQARERTLTCHTAAVRAGQLEQLLERGCRAEAEAGVA
jgi:spore maturation protein CgeB